MSLEKDCPLCGKTLKHQGALNMHMYHCKMKQASQGQKEEEKPETCKHERKRLLNLRAAQEKMAYNAGYKEICIDCQELF